MVSPSGKPFTVTQISMLIRNSLETTFGIVEIEGEITDYRGPTASGHHYFSLKDDASRLSAVLFAGRAAAIRVRIENGKKVRATGKITAFAGSSRYQIIVANLVEAGIGDLAAKFEELKRRLEGEGLFAEERKRPLPLLPLHVGAVTSATGSVIRDFVNVLSRRYPNVDLLVAPSRVQGEGAAEEIAAGIVALGKVGVPGSGFLEELPRRDVIVVMRGGGSMEELWCFNEEVVARAVLASPVPVISGVGHQTDFTICDFVADVRAPTPSAAAELLVRPKADFQRDVRRLSERTAALLNSSLQTAKARFAAVASNRVFAEPAHAVENFAQRVDALVQEAEALATGRLYEARRRFAAAESALSVAKAAKLPGIRARIDALVVRATNAFERTVDSRRALLAACLRQLSALNPLAVLDRGYSITLLDDGRAVRKAEDAPEGTRLTTLLSGNSRIVSVVGNAPRAKPRHRGGAVPADSPDSPQQELSLGL